jgi:hypothetical protein
VFVVDFGRDSSVIAVLRHQAAVSTLAWRDVSGEPAFAVATDSRLGNIYLWTPECAMCVTIPSSRDGADDGDHTKRGKQGASPGCRAVTRIHWGANGASLLLCDDFTETFSTASLLA